MVGTAIRVVSTMGKIIIVIGVLLEVFIVGGVLINGNPLGNIIVATIFIVIIFSLLLGSLSYIERFLIKCEANGLENKSTFEKIITIILSIPIGILFFIGALIISIFSEEKRKEVFSRKSVEIVKKKAGKIVPTSYSNEYLITNPENTSQWYGKIVPTSYSNEYLITNPGNTSQWYGKIRLGSFKDNYEVSDNNGNLKFILRVKDNSGDLSIALRDDGSNIFDVWWEI